MADNFGYLIAYGPDGPDGKGYPNPEIITAIEDILKKRPYRLRVRPLQIGKERKKHNEQTI